MAFDLYFRLLYIFICLVLPTSRALKNVALNKPTKQSSTVGSFVPSIAVDGDVLSSFYTKTRAQRYPWWRVDLMDSYLVESVRITSRKDCCWERLRKILIRVGNSARIPDRNKMCAYYSGSFGRNEARELVCVSQIKGNYVFVMLRDTEYLELVEVEVLAFDDSATKHPVDLTGNIALRKPTRQSSDYIKCTNRTMYCTPAHAAVDGRSSLFFNNGTCSSTNRQLYPWWMVDLLDRPIVKKVSLTNRGDCCSQRLQMIEIRVGDKPCSPKSNALCRYIEGQIGKGATFEVDCKPARRGRFVFVTLHTTTYLTLCEVQVFAMQGATLPSTLGNYTCKKTRKDGGSYYWVIGIVFLVVILGCCCCTNRGQRPPRSAPPATPAQSRSREHPRSDNPAASSQPARNDQPSTNEPRQRDDGISSIPPPIAVLPLPDAPPPRYEEIDKWDGTSLAAAPPLYNDLDFNALPVVSHPGFETNFSFSNPTFSLEEPPAESSSDAV